VLHMQTQVSRVRPNNSMNLTIWPVTRLPGLGSAPEHFTSLCAQGARPSQPAGYRWRWADHKSDSQANATT